MLFYRTCMIILGLCWFTHAYGTNVFDTVKVLPSGQRIAKALDIYDEEVKRKDSVFSISAIRRLIETSVALKDHSLHCFALSLLADQYARIRGYNPYSAELHQSAVILAEKYRLPLMIGMCNYRMGGYYYSFKKYPLAFEFLLRADNYFKEIGYREVPDIDKILFFIGSIYYETGNYEKSEGYLLKMQQLKKVTDYLRKQSLNTLAMIYRHQHDTARALSYFQQTLQEAIREHDSTWIGISYTNMGNQYFLAGAYDKAYPLLQKAAPICLSKNLPEDAFADRLLLARIYLLRNQVSAARQNMQEAMAIPNSPFGVAGRQYLYEAQVAYYIKTNQLTKALKTQQLLMQVKDSLIARSDQQAYEKILLRVETEKHLDELDEIEEDAKAAELKRNTIIVVLILLLIVMLLLYRSYRLKAKNTAAILQTEKTMAEEKLQHARQLLQNFTRNNQQKNEMIEQFAKELERLKSNMTGNPLYKERLQNFEKLIHSTILTDEEWEAFRGLFDKVHKGFFSRLQEKISGLTETDTRLAALIRLDLPNNEIARMLGMDAHMVEQARLRLRNSIHAYHDGITIEDLVKAI